jgi:diadenosine tetraphosphate (Ap4A) HIT family hydrolase
VARRSGLSGHPLSLSRQRTRRSKPRITRYLNRELWQEVKLHIDIINHGNGSKQRPNALHIHVIAARKSATYHQANVEGWLQSGTSH